jgi:hypothetical protein
MTILPEVHSPTVGRAARRPGGRTTRSRLLVLGAAAVFAVLAAPGAHASDTRSFAGFYNFLDAVQLADGYSVRLVARVYNFGDADLAGAVVTVADSVEAGASRSFGTASIARGESLRLSGDVTVSSQEYERWRAGEPPVVRVEYVDAFGESRSDVVELAWALMEEE